MRLLIVEDAWIIAKMMERALVADGFEVAKAATVEQALALIQSTAFDAAILDPNLDDVSAEPVAEALGVKNIPFLVISGSSVPAGSGALSAAPFLGKPFEMDELVQRLRALGKG